MLKTVVIGKYKFKLKLLMNWRVDSNESVPCILFSIKKNNINNKTISKLNNFHKLNFRP